jgi:hypothetical protein
LILPDPGTDAALADNLTEVAIARVAEARHGTLAGNSEFRRRLGMEPAQARTCLDDIACLGRVGVALGVRRAVTGSVRAEADKYLVNLTLTDIESGKTVARFFRLVRGGLQDLMAATQEGVDDLFRKREEPGRVRVESIPDGARVLVDEMYVGTTPVISGPLVGGEHLIRLDREGYFPWKTTVKVLPGDELQIRVAERELERRRAWPGYLASTGVIAGLAAGTVGVTLGRLSQIEPSAGSRRTLQDDLEHRKDFARGANVAFVAGGALLAGALVVTILFARDVFGQ